MTAALYSAQINTLKTQTETTIKQKVKAVAFHQHIYTDDDIIILRKTNVHNAIKLDFYGSISLKLNNFLDKT